MSATNCSAYREVVYDLGPTFVERHRTRTALDGLITAPDPASAFRIEVEAYGDFDMSARLAVGDGKVEDLTHTAVVPAKRIETQEARRAFEAPASAAGSDWTGVVLGTEAVALASAALVAGGGEHFWPGSTVDPARLPAAARYALLAAAAGGLGAALQALLT